MSWWVVLDAFVGQQSGSSLTPSMPQRSLRVFLGVPAPVPKPCVPSEPVSEKRTRICHHLGLPAKAKARGAGAPFRVHQWQDALRTALFEGNYAELESLPAGAAERAPVWWRKGKHFLSSDMELAADVGSAVLDKKRKRAAVVLLEEDEAEQGEQSKGRQGKGRKRQGPETADGNGAAKRQKLTGAVGKHNADDSEAVRPRMTIPEAAVRWYLEFSHKHVAAFLVYVDDFLAAGPRDVIQPLLTRLIDVRKGSNPDFLGRQPGDVDTMRFLGLDIELGPEDSTWLVHQQSYIYAFLQEMFDPPECLKDRRTPDEPESFSDKPHVHPHAQKARVKHPPLQPGQDPLEHTPGLRFVGVLLWVSLRTRPDIAWAVARITRQSSCSCMYSTCCPALEMDLAFCLVL